MINQSDDVGAANEPGTRRFLPTKSPHRVQRVSTTLESCWKDALLTRNVGRLGARTANTKHSILTLTLAFADRYGSDPVGMGIWIAGMFGGNFLLQRAMKTVPWLQIADPDRAKAVSVTTFVQALSQVYFGTTLAPYAITPARAIPMSIVHTGYDVLIAAAAAAYSKSVGALKFSEDRLSRLWSSFSLERSSKDCLKRSGCFGNVILITRDSATQEASFH